MVNIKNWTGNLKKLTKGKKCKIGHYSEERKKEWKNWQRLEAVARIFPTTARKLAESGHYNAIF